MKEVSSLAKVISEQKIHKPITDKTVRMLADSIYNTLKEEGCEERDIIGVSSQLIGLVTDRIKDEH